MKAQDLMTQGVLSCRPDDSLAVAAKLMWDGDCGIVPVLEDGVLCGLITDRDICMAAAIRGLSADQIEVGQVMNREPASCLPDTKLQQALDLMRSHRIRRLPVVDGSGAVVGLLSINDIILEAKSTRSKTGGPTYKEVVAALQGICGHRELPAVI